jgi:hypothetical protein
MENEEKNNYCEKIEIGRRLQNTILIIAFGAGLFYYLKLVCDFVNGAG